MAVLVLRLRYLAPDIPLEHAKAWYTAFLDAVVAWNLMRRMRGLTAHNQLERLIFVADLDGIDKANLRLVKVLKELQVLSDDRYPDFMSTAFFFNASSIA